MSATITCYKCGIEFCLPDRIYRARLEDHKEFYCSSGHRQSFLGKSDLEKAKERIKWLEIRVDSLSDLLEYTERGRAAYMGHFNRIKKEITVEI